MKLNHVVYLDNAFTSGLLVDALAGIPEDLKKVQLTKGSYEAECVRKRADKTVREKQHKKQRRADDGVSIPKLTTQLQ